MATINGRHFYRFQYLKSDHWQNLRLEKMVEVDAHCLRCGIRDLSNDVHHVRYRKLYDVELSDLIVLCRDCHKIMHEVLEASKIGDENAVAKVMSKMREFKCVHQPKQMGDLFQKMRVQGILPVRASKPRPPLQKPKRPRKLHEAIKKAYRKSYTRLLFIELRKVGFLDDLCAAFESGEIG